MPEVKENIPFTHIDPKSFFGFRAMPSDKLYIGTELELEAKGDKDKIADEANTFLKRFCVIKHDSSIDNGFEIASAPCGLKFHQRNWNGFFKFCNRTKKLFSADNVGMHVHISRKYLTPLQMGKMIVFINNPNNKKFIELIAGREIKGNKWCYTNEALTPSYGSKKIRNKRGYDSLAVKFSYKKTIEFRIFYSTVNRNIFLKNIEFCHALTKFCRTCFMSINGAQSIENFCRFVFDWKKDYPHLYLFLKDNNKIPLDLLADNNYNNE